MPSKQPGIEDAALAFTPATREDAPELACRATRAFAEDVALFGEPPPGIDTAQEHERLIHAGHVFKILVGGRTIGGLALMRDEEDALWIHVLFVDPAFQNRGIGRRALAWIEAQHPDAPCFMLETPQAKARNLHLYLQAGYTPCGSREVAAKPGLVLVRMRKMNPSAARGE